MLIHEAVREAREKGLAIRRTGNLENSLWGVTAVLPTDTFDCCFIFATDRSDHRAAKIEVGRRWNPLAEDLMADDWELTDYFSREERIAVIR